MAKRKVRKKTGPEIALEIASAGHFPVPVIPRSKVPVESEWPDSRISETEVPGKFQVDSNVGILTGVTQLLDVDLDSDESLDLADDYLPDTGFAR